MAGSQVHFLLWEVMMVKKQTKEKINIQTLLKRLRKLAVENVQLKSELASAQAIACYDALTGVYTRREFMEHGEYFMKLLNGIHVEGNMRTPRPHMTSLAVCFIDLNDLSKINDTQGHHSGDEAIAAIAQCIKHNIRNTDVLGRIGGDEFAVLFPNQSLANAKKIVRKMRVSIATVFVGEKGKGIRLGASFGVATTDEGHKTLSDLMAVADARMYRDKNSQKKKKKGKVD